MNSELLNLIENAPKVTLGDYIVRVERTNSAGAYGAEDVRGVSNTKGFMETRANIEGRSLKKFLVIEPFEFVFNRRTTRNGERLGLGFNMTDRAFIFFISISCAMSSIGTFAATLGAVQRSSSTGTTCAV